MAQIQSHYEMKTAGIKPGESTVKDLSPGWNESRDNVLDTVHSVDNLDTFVLARLGKRQVLKVCLPAISSETFRTVNANGAVSAILGSCPCSPSPAPSSSPGKASTPLCRTTRMAVQPAFCMDISSYGQAH